MISLKDNVSLLPLVGEIYAKRLEKLGIVSIEDLLFHFPFRYDDFSLISPVGQVQPGETVTIKARIDKMENSFTKTNRKIQKALVSDASGSIELIWFNQPFLTRTIRVNDFFFFSGKCDWFGAKKVLVSPQYEKVNRTEPIHTGRLVPIYPETYGVSSKWLRSRIKTALEIFDLDLEEFLDQEILEKQNLTGEKRALEQIHFPNNQLEVEKAKERLAFDELFLLQLSALKRKAEWQKISPAINLLPKNKEVDQLIKKLPFKLTGAQERCVEEVLADLTNKIPMNRLLEGDVGSGKTVVAAIAGYLTFLNGYQTLYMAPTEILSHQHFETFKKLLEPFGVKIKLITSSHKNEVDFQADIIIGTHSLLYQLFEKEKIGLVIIDEQHRFGVEQRALLTQKGFSPHFLTMTATPIPRTIALVLFSDLDLSLIDEMPQGRIPVKTWVVPKEKRTDGYNWIKKQVSNTPNQAFIICPLIEESESLKDVKAVTQEFEVLSKQVFSDLRLGLLHGKIKPKEKQEILSNFKEGKLDILVSTPVVEVGIDIPQATIMLIEAAERFGLAQLHQLRGRVGRGDQASYCLLFSESQEEKVLQRLKIMEITSSGMKLAEEDLKLRGPGEIYGTKQHGFFNLKIASFNDLALIKKTRSLAEEFTASEQELSLPLKKRLEKYKISSV